MMENMDTSCGTVDPSNESAMSVDEEMDVCSENETSQLREFSSHANTNDVDASCSHISTSNNVTSEMGDSANTTVLLNSSFPNQQAPSCADATEKVERFPLGNAKECNQPNSVLSSSERIKSNLLNNTVGNELRPMGKENMFASSYDETMFDFPTETKRQSGKFPLDTAELPSAITAPSVQKGVSPDEEQFTPGNDYIFSEADFDCLLSRGSQTVTAGETATTTSSQAAATSELPRNSVLINFDPLLRRQTIAKRENNGLIGNLGTPSACLALVEFAQQQQHQQNSFECSSVIPLLNNTGADTREEPDLVICESLTSVLLEIPTEQRDETLTTDYRKSNLIQTECMLEESSAVEVLEKSSVESKYSSDAESSIDSVKCIPNLLQQEKEGVVPLESTENPSLPGDFLEQNYLPSVEKEQEYTAHPGVQDSVEEALEEEILKQETYSDVVLVENIVPHSGNQQQEVEGQAPNSDLVVLIESQPISANAEENKDSAHLESNVLISYTNMLAEPLQEKQNSTIHDMSDGRMSQHEDENVDTGKKNKNEDVNIADMEKKMHDVELREENMLKRITEKDKTISKMSNVVEAYERTIAELISEKEMLIRNHELECESLKQDNEINAQHLESLEKTFSNLYAKYERMKKNAIKYKEHEETLLEKVMKLEECLRAQEQRYEKMKSHAMSQLEIANIKIDEAIRNHSQESAKLKAQIKKEELYRISINEQLIQKSKENEELVKICDELISETN